MDKLKNPEIVEVFQAKVGGRLSVLNVLEDDINTLTDNVKEILQETATEVLGRKG